MCIRLRKVLTQQEKRRRGDICEFPLDPVIEILMRLPTKSLMRFKCVSKQWHLSNLISGRDFCNSLFTLTRQQQQPRLYMSLVDKDGKRLLLSISSTSPHSTCLVVDQDLSISGMGGFSLNVFHGLMCFSVREKACIYNPSTKQLLTLPAIKCDIIVEQGQEKNTRYYIGHDPVSDQYKILCTIAISSLFLGNLKSEHWVFAVEAGGSWKRVVPLKYYRPRAPLSLGWSTSGWVIHYMASLPMNMAGPEYACAVVSLNVRSEELTIFLGPWGWDVRDLALLIVKTKVGLIEYGGKIAIFDHSHLKYEGCVDLWVLEDAGKKEWSRQTVVLQPCHRHLVQGIDLIVKGTTQEGKVILAPVKMRSRFYILCYDIQSNDLRKIKIKGVPQHSFDKECYFDLKFMDT